MKLELTEDEINIILNLLNQAPYGQVYRVIQHIQSQVQNVQTQQPIKKES